MGDPGKYGQCRVGGGRRQWDEKGAQYKIWVVMRRAELGKGESRMWWGVGCVLLAEARGGATNRGEEMGSSS